MRRFQKPNRHTFKIRIDLWYERHDGRAKAQQKVRSIVDRIDGKIVVVVVSFFDLDVHNDDELSFADKFLDFSGLLHYNR